MSVFMAAPRQRKCESDLKNNTTDTKYATRITQIQTYIKRLALTMQKDNNLIIIQPRWVTFDFQFIQSQQQYLLIVNTQRV